MSDEEWAVEENIQTETETATCLTVSYLSSLGPKKNAGELRRAWATLLYVTSAGFPMSQTEVQAIDGLVRYLEKATAGPLRDSE